MTERRRKNQMEITEKFYCILRWYTAHIARFPRQSRMLIGQPLQQRLLGTIKRYGDKQHRS